MKSLCLVTFAYLVQFCKVPLALACYNKQPHTLHCCDVLKVSAVVLTIIRKQLITFVFCDVNHDKHYKMVIFDVKSCTKHRVHIRSYWLGGKLSDFDEGGVALVPHWRQQVRFDRILQIK